MTLYRRQKSYLFFLIAAMLIGLIYIIGFVLLIHKKEYDMIVILSFFLFFIGGMFLFIALFERNSILKIDNERIVFHYKVFSHDKGLRGFNRKGLSINWKDIKIVTIKHIEGDKVLSSDTYFATFVLNDSRIFETTFFHYGKLQEQDIINKIRNHVPFHQSKHV